MVHGTIHPQKIIRNKGMQEGDHLILTKPLGCGAITAGIRKGKVSREFEEEAIRVMQQLNKKASEIMIRHPVHAATDVTGFGLLGHLNEMVQASQATVKLALLRLDFLPGARELAQQNIVPMATQENLKDSYQITGFSEDISLAERLLLADAQTSGGLIMAISAEKKSALVEELSQAGIKPQEFAVVSHLGSPGIQVVRDF
jgi:selenide,water dikinase